ncbi:M14 family zinc carboxypeptidase [Spirillospora sp. NPDC048911]|uniref:M14 family metallopeptidase n=1 Tax=Spirillospora sp. NPDC048911 TaxID=3364527 RepID=UPI003715A1E0
MRRKVTSFFAALTLGAGLVAAAPATAAPTGPTRANDKIEVFTGQLTVDHVKKLRDAGLDHEDVALGKASGGKISAEVVTSRAKGEALIAKGVPLKLKTVDGKTASQQARTLAAQGNVFRPYSGAGNIREEIVKAAADHPAIAKAYDLGTSLKGKPITAVRVTKGARSQPFKSGRPAVVYQATQHAREWITPENVRRQLHHFLDNYGKNAEITKIVDTTDLWFVPVVNVDGYDQTFNPDYRLWRKNLRDNDGDGQLTNLDGVDPNRNFPYRWGYDDEGSSPYPESETYRGKSPGSEPETKVQDGFIKRLKPKYIINYHSAAELLLYGVGWQTQTPSPDDHIFEALLGDDAHPAVPGYDPDLGAELYTTNGEYDGHMTEKRGALTTTPEMSTCQTASAIDPNDQWDPADCASVFNFPDDEKLIAQEFQKNLPLAIATAKSAHTPDHPVSVVGRTTPDLVADAFDTSYGRTQPVAVTARRSLKGLELNYRINSGRTKTGDVRRWKGGERYGDEGTDYYAEYRGTVRNTKPGDKVEVWFEARNKKTPVSSKHFTYTVASQIGGNVLVLAGEDVTGASPAQGATEAKYASRYVASLKKAGYKPDVYDIDKQGRKAPHHLGVLGHYKAVVWETGDDIITRNVGQPGGTAAKLALDTELSVRDYLNEGGKLLYAGKFAGYSSNANGAYFYQPNVPSTPECADPNDPTCLPLLNDFPQYYLGAYVYIDGGGQDADGNIFPLKGTAGTFQGLAATLNSGDSANNQDHTGAFVTTSSFLPKKQFPQFASEAPVKWTRPGANPFGPHSGAWYAYSQRGDYSYKRLTKTIDLTGKTSGNLSFWTSFETEASWDHLFVEAHTAGQDDWTTLPDANGNTTTDTGSSCQSGWRTIHPFTQHYQGPNCEPTGTTGSWNAASGNSGGWKNWSLDLTPYAGKKVEVSVAYVSDWGTQGAGVLLDDAKVTTNAGTDSETSFEADFGGWTAASPPEGSGLFTATWTRSNQALDEGAVVTTKDTVYTGFGAEGLDTAARDDFIKRAMRHLLR